MEYITGGTEIETLNPNKCCQLCEKKWGTQDGEGTVEYLVLMPCGHIFGSICIKHFISTELGDHSGREYRRCPARSHSLHYRGCGHTIRPQRITFAPDAETGYLGLSNTHLYHLPQKRVVEWEMPDDCHACSASGLRLRAALNDQVKELGVRQKSRAWKTKGVEQRGLSPHLLDEVEEKIKKALANIEDLTPFVEAEYDQFLRSRPGW
jgi:hypothetical protein